MAEYDSFADIYDVWTATAASAQANLDFYLDAYRAAEGPIVELGVGDGRIAIEAAKQGRTIVGIDVSSAMLLRCRERADRAGVQDRLVLMQADFRSFTLDQPAALIALPYHTLGHLPALADKRAALRHVFSQLRPGGRFVFDDFQMTPALLDQMRQVQLRAEYRSATGAQILLWVTSRVDEAAQSIDVATWEDETGADGRLAERRYRHLTLSWLRPTDARALLEETGFVVEACFGDFEKTPFAETTAQEQIWVTRKPN
jgi:ubiquinone/menaquinone biosynthesis C-methylase UbiE